MPAAYLPEASESEMEAMGYEREVLDRLLSIQKQIMLTMDEALIRGYFPDLSKTEMHTLAAIGPYDRKTMGETAAALNITTGTLTVAVDRLVRKKYVSRQRASQDRRIVLLELTRKGKVACRLLWRFHLLLVERVVQHYDEHERHLLLDMLGRIDEYLMEQYERYSHLGEDKEGSEEAR